MILLDDGLNAGEVVSKFLFFGGLELGPLNDLEGLVLGGVLQLREFEEAAVVEGLLHAIGLLDDLFC